MLPSKMLPTTATPAAPSITHLHADRHGPLSASAQRAQEGEEEEEEEEAEEEETVVRR